jgi:uncharacterized protein (DUF362 family)
MSAGAPLARIAEVGSYRDRDAIRNFAASLFDGDPELAALLAKPDPARLFVLKPNWVQESHEYRPDVWEPVITHPALLVSLIEVLGERIAGSATLCICDAPHTYADFAAIAARGGFAEQLEVLRRRFPALRIELIDLRRELWFRKDRVVVERRPNREDPRGYVQLDLGRDSLFFGHSGEGRYYGADYDSEVVNAHHRGELQEYLIAGSPMACDLFINLPKLKTHKKTGITCCLKNLVGINGDKNWLPHHTEGGPERGGDEFPSETPAVALERRAKKLGQKVALSVPVLGSWLYRRVRRMGIAVRGDSETTARNGNWSGNDTCWRMALDLNRALLYGRSDGSWADGGPPRRYLAIVDGIVGGQGNGPLCPEPADSRVLLAGRDPAVVDALATRLMGFDPREIPIVAHAFEPHRWPITAESLASIRVHDGRVGRELALAELAPAIPGGFAPHFGWSRLRRAA